MWFRIAENGSVNGVTAVNSNMVNHHASPVTPPKRKTSPVITGHLITGYHAVMVTSFSALVSIHYSVTVSVTSNSYTPD